MQRSNFQIVRQQPVLQQVVEEDVLRFIKDWRSTYGSMQTVGADTALLLTSQSSIDAAQLIQLRAVLARSLSQGTAAERAQTALDMTTYPALAASASAAQLRSHVQACLAIDTALMRALEQYYTRSGSDSLLKAVRRACVWPGDRGQFQVVLSVYVNAVTTAIVAGCPVTGQQTVAAAMGNLDHKPFVKAIIEGFPVEQRTSWLVESNSGNFPTVQSLLDKLNDEIHYFHTNRERFQEAMNFESGYRGQTANQQRDTRGGRGSGGKASKKGGAAHGRGGSKGSKPYGRPSEFQGICDKCKQWGHKHKDCPRASRVDAEQWRPSFEKGKGATSGWSSKAGKSAKKGGGKPSGKAGKKGTKGKADRPTSASGGAGAETPPAIAAVMQSGALPSSGHEYESLFGEGDESGDSGWNQPEYPRWSTWGAYGPHSTYEEWSDDAAWYRWDDSGQGGDAEYAEWP
jgi:hypothetical protein